MRWVFVVIGAAVLCVLFLVLFMEGGSQRSLEKGEHRAQPSQSPDVPGSPGARIVSESGRESRAPLGASGVAGSGLPSAALPADPNDLRDIDYIGSRVGVSLYGEPSFADAFLMLEGHVHRGEWEALHGLLRIIDVCRALGRDTRDEGSLTIEQLAARDECAAVPARHPDYAAELVAAAAQAGVRRFIIDQFSLVPSHVPRDQRYESDWFRQALDRLEALAMTGDFEATREAGVQRFLAGSESDRVRSVMHLRRALSLAPPGNSESVNLLRVSLFRVCASFSSPPAECEGFTSLLK